MENIVIIRICIIMAMIIASKLPITARAYNHFQRSEYNACIILKAASRKIPNHEQGTITQKLSEVNNVGYFYTEVVKKSKFVVKISKASNYDDAISFIEKYKDDKASHNCWAFRQSSIIERSSDDGEPNGTAGKPILNILQAENICEAVVLVTRYYGGIQLGAGGLIRAYGNAAKNGLLAMKKEPYIEECKVEIVVPMEDVGNIYQILQSFQTRQLQEFYLPAVSSSSLANESHNSETVDATVIKISLHMACDEVQVLQDRVIDKCKGRGKVSIVFT